MANTQDTQQCRARTEDGERCTRSAGEDGFCFQHGPEDETADDAAGNGDGADAAQAANEQGETAADGGTSAEQAESEGDEGDENAEQTDAGSDEQEESDAESEEGDEEAERADEEDESEDDESEQTDAEHDGSGGSISGVMDVRTHTESVTSDVVGAPLDRIIEIERQDAEGEGGWLVVVEALERKSIPDTEDLLGRYAIQFGEDGTVVGYRLQERYRRSAEISDE